MHTLYCAHFKVHFKVHFQTHQEISNLEYFQFKVHFAVHALAIVHISKSFSASQHAHYKGHFEAHTLHFAGRLLPNCKEFKLAIFSSVHRIVLQHLSACKMFSLCGKRQWKETDGRINYIYCQRTKFLIMFSRAESKYIILPSHTRISSENRPIFLQKPNLLQDKNQLGQHGNYHNCSKQCDIEKVH